MKKLNIVIIAAVAATTVFTACENKAPKQIISSLKNQNDSLNYAYGVAVGNSLKQYYLAADTTDKALALQIDSLFAGIAEGLNAKTDAEFTEIADLGQRFGSYVNEQKKNGFLGDSTLSLNIGLLKQGVINGAKDAKLIFTTEDANAYLNNTMAVRQYGENKAAGEKFLAENAKRPEVVTTASGLQYEILVAGKGAVPTTADKVKVHYHGTLTDGTVFDSSVDRGEPISFDVTGVIPGWTEALQLMPVGSKWKLYLPQQLAYGERGSGGTIKPYSALVFEVELLGIEK
jgi:FKBP-type peptidyl-prolyl cis-trans isomerase FklB